MGRSMKGDYFEEDVDKLVRGALADMDDDIDVEDMLDYVVGHMDPMTESQREHARLIIERRVG
jgi:hypothetical protein